VLRKLFITYLENYWTTVATHFEVDKRSAEEKSCLALPLKNQGLKANFL
jgi:uncharacterized membrane protein